MLKLKWASQSWEWNHLASGRCHWLSHKHIRKAEEVNLKANSSFFTSLLITKEHVFGAKFTGLYGAVGFITIRDFSFWGESDLWSDVWPAMDGVLCLSILLEGEVSVSNNFTNWRQNGFKIGLRDKFASHTFEAGKLYFKWDRYLHNFFLQSVIFPYNSIHTQAVTYTVHHVVFWAWGACDISKVHPSPDKTGLGKWMEQYVPIE